MADEYRVRFVEDENGSFEECNGEPRPLTRDEYAVNYYMKDGKRIPYADYLAYYGDPSRHVYMAVILDKKCECCGQWKQNVESLWGIDFMDDNKETNYIGSTYTPEEITERADELGYLAKVARELLKEFK